MNLSRAILNDDPVSVERKKRDFLGRKEEGSHQTTCTKICEWK